MKNPIRALCVALLLAGSFASQAQVPVLSSYPQASAVLFLDFDGHEVKGTGFNWAGPILAGGSGLNPDQVTEVFNRVAEDYRPFNLNVTTDSTKYLAAPLMQRMRVIITASSDWYGSGAGGVAFLRSFKWGDDTPCFVFSALFNYNVKRIAEATSHEAGHTLGLQHQAKYDVNCNKLTDYDLGQGNGEIGWAPIMGAGYYQNFTIWHNGKSTLGCNIIQNDLEVITSGANGFGFREDDHRNSFDTATQPTFSGNQFSVEGVIERNTDQDMFKFIMPGNGQFELDASPNNVGIGNSGSDLDMQVTLYDESENILSVYNPGTLLNSLVDTFLTSGSYYLKIEGKGNEFASEYASLGSYSLVGKIQNASSPLALHRLELKGLQSGDKRQFNWLIKSDEAVLEQILEVAEDGRNFVPLTSTEKDIREYVYRYNDKGTPRYRLNVTFENGRRNYSNVITISSENNNTYPRLAGNLIQSGSIHISSPGKYNYTVFDFTGKTMKKGQLSGGLNDVSAAGLSAGIYMIRFEGNDQQWTEKFVRQ